MTASPYAMPPSPDEPLLLLGDCLDVLARQPAESVDVVIADPEASS
jgi:predicted methyltransferase